MLMAAVLSLFAWTSDGPTPLQAQQDTSGDCCFQCCYCCGYSTCGQLVGNLRGGSGGIAPINELPVRAVALDVAMPY